MEDEQGGVFDWVNLPSGATEESLWHSLHDARLSSITSDRMERKIRLEFDIPHLRMFHEFPEGTTFVLLLTGVQSARVLLDIPWPGETPIPEGLSYEESEKLRDFYFSKWRKDSGSWDEFEAKLATGETSAEIRHAAYSLCADGRFALKLELCVDDETYPEVFLRSEALEIHQSDGEPLSLERFRQLGESYWADFAARGEALRAANALNSKE